MDQSKDYYAILGILPSADEAIIKAVHRALAKKWHPDTFKGDKAFAETKMKEVNEAYDVLSKASSRAEYDARRSSTAGQQREYEGPEADDRAPFEAERATDWQFVLEYYPAVEKMRAELAQFSSALALTFQVILLEMKAFGQAELVKTGLIKDFLQTHFGSNLIIQDFAEGLIRAGLKSAAKELNRLIRVGGSPTDVDARRIVVQINKKLATEKAAAGASRAGKGVDDERASTKHGTHGADGSGSPSDGPNKPSLPTWLVGLLIAGALAAGGAAVAQGSRTGLFLAISVAILSVFAFRISARKD